MDKIWYSHATYYYLNKIKGLELYDPIRIGLKQYEFFKKLQNEMNRMILYVNIFQIP